MGQEKMFDVITIGGATRDIFFRTKEGRILKEANKSYLSFEYGSKIIPDQTFFSYGGGAANSAIAMAKMGLNVATYICLGQEGTGDIVVENLESQGVDARFVVRDKEEHTAVSFILSIPGGDRIIFNYPGANIDLDIKNWEELKTNWIYLTSLRGKSANLLPKIAKFLKHQKINLAFNPGETQLRKGLSYLKKILKETSVLILNFDEAKELASLGVKSSKIDDVLKALQSKGPEIVVITDGKNGSYAFDSKKIFYQKCISERVFDTTGAGDAYGSTFVASLILGFGIQKAMKLAALNSASVVGHLGAQKGLLTLKELKK